MAKNRAPWEIPPRSRHCSDGQEPFQTPTEAFSEVSWDSKGNLVRRDYCAACWAKRADKAVEGTYWRATLTGPEELRRKPTSADERALDLLREALEGTDHASEAEAYVIAQILARMGRLTKRQELDKEGKRYIIYEYSETEEMFCVPKMGLSSREIMEMNIDLAQRLQGEEKEEEEERK